MKQKNNPSVHPTNHPTHQSCMHTPFIYVVIDLPLFKMHSHLFSNPLEEMVKHKIQIDPKQNTLAGFFSWTTNSNATSESTQSSNDPVEPKTAKLDFPQTSDSNPPEAQPPAKKARLEPPHSSASTSNKSHPPAAQPPAKRARLSTYQSSDSLPASTEVQPEVANESQLALVTSTDPIPPDIVRRKILCVVCGRNGVKKTANYNDIKGKSRQLCSQHAKEAGTHKVNYPCIQCSTEGDDKQAH